MKLLRVFTVILAMIAALVAGLFLYGRRAEDGKVAHVTIKGNANPGMVVVHITDAAGKPIKGLSVCSESESGTSNPPVDTDDLGIAMIRPGESEVIGIHINSEKVWTSPYSGSLFAPILSPSCESGVAFRVVMKAEQAHAGNRR